MYSNKEIRATSSAKVVQMLFVIAAIIVFVAIAVPYVLSTVRTVEVASGGDLTAVGCQAEYTTWQDGGEFPSQTCSESTSGIELWCENHNVTDGKMAQACANVKAGK